MKIKNDFISIKVGKKHYEFRNLILDAYLKVFATSQISERVDNYIPNIRSLRYLWIKFDEPIENIQEDSIVPFNLFDVTTIENANYSQEVSDNKIVTTYQYFLDADTELFTGENTEELPKVGDYWGRKIATIGFVQHWLPTMVDTAMAILDVSNYNIYLEKDEEFSVTRQDTITSDALFYSSDTTKIKNPIHLQPLYNKSLLPMYEYEPYIDISFSRLYSIGFSNSIDEILIEFVKDKDFIVIQNENKLEIKEIKNNYLGYLLYPSTNLYPSASLYPLQGKLKYLIIKYKLWQEVVTGVDEEGENITEIKDTGYYYHQAIELNMPINKALDLVLSYDRI